MKERGYQHDGLDLRLKHTDEYPVCFGRKTWVVVLNDHYVFDTSQHFEMANQTYESLKSTMERGEFIHYPKYLRMGQVARAVDDNGNEKHFRRVSMRAAVGGPITVEICETKRRVQIPSEGFVGRLEILAHDPFN